MKIEEKIIELEKRISALESLLSINTKESFVFEKKQKTDSARDKTKYMFNGKILSKNRLVLTVVEDYVGCNNPTFTELLSVFDKSLQGSLGVFDSLNNIEHISDKAKRFFLKDDELIVLKDGSTIAVCTQWGAFNINNFIKRAELLGYVIERL